tara:strand:+ start:615 stop:863 length:249 start_codon:yes stop_codon:yes gene_type:complete
MDLIGIAAYSNLYGYPAAFLTLSLSGVWLFKQTKLKAGLVLFVSAFTYVLCQLVLWLFPVRSGSYVEGSEVMFVGMRPVITP